MQERAQAKGSITYIHREKGGIPDRTIGRIRSLYGNLLLGIPKASFKDISQETRDELKETFRDVEWNGNIEVRYNHSPFFNQFKRLFQKDRRTNIFSRSIIGVPYTVYSSLSGKTGRTDIYNPHTETALIYSPNKYRALQQLGKAQHYDHVKFSTAYALLLSFPIFRSMREFWGSKHVMEKLPTEEERQKARKILEPNFGIQVAQDAGAIAGVVKNISFIPFLPAVGALIGHIQARTIKENIFYDKSTPAPVAQPVSQPLPAI
ncbi:MAG: hypothetical protein HY430_02670 [Candidatus Levybacteria bacterium]|nr:hypothetical protein [Candidatus Levybacteria bacterium]